MRLPTALVIPDAKVGFTAENPEDLKTARVNGVAFLWLQFG